MVYDILYTLNRFSDLKEYRHFEGNSLHIKASLMGSSCTVIVENGELKLGTWQGIYFVNLTDQGSESVLKNVVNKVVII